VLISAATADSLIGGGELEGGIAEDMGAADSNKRHGTISGEWRIGQQTRGGRGEKLIEHEVEASHGSSGGSGTHRSIGNCSTRVAWKRGAAKFDSSCVRHCFKFTAQASYKAHR
jgi:hypothetical protein